MYQYRKMTGHSSSVTSLRRYVKERETPVPVYVGLKLYASLRTKKSLLLGCSFHMIVISQPATISVWKCWKSMTLKVYLLLAILTLKHLRLLQRIILTSMLYQLRWRNTFMELVWQLCSFHWREIRVWNKM